MLIPLQYPEDHCGSPQSQKAQWSVVPHWGCTSENRSHHLAIQWCSFAGHQPEHFQGPGAPFLPGIQTRHAMVTKHAVECHHHSSHHMLILWHTQCSAKGTLLCAGCGIPCEMSEEGCKGSTRPPHSFSSCYLGCLLDRMKCIQGCKDTSWPAVLGARAEIGLLVPPWLH